MTMCLFPKLPSVKFLKLVNSLKHLTSDDAFNFYNQYAREAGFSTRVDNSRRKKGTNEFVWKLFVCLKEGKTNNKY